MNLLGKDKGQRSPIAAGCLGVRKSLLFFIPAIFLISSLSCICEGRKTTGSAREKRLPLPPTAEGKKEKARSTSLLFPRKAETSKQRNPEPSTPEMQLTFLPLQKRELLTLHREQHSLSRADTAPHNPLLKQERLLPGQQISAAPATSHSSGGLQRGVLSPVLPFPCPMAASAEGQQAPDESHSSNKHCSNST